MDWRATVDKASRHLLLREPFYGHLLVGLVKTQQNMDCMVRLAPAGTQALLQVNPDRWLAASEGERIAALRHELVHLMLRHPLRTQGRNLEIWGMACDLVVNQITDTHEITNPLRIQDFPGFEPDQTADAYYELLRPLQGEAPQQAQWRCDHGCQGGSHGSWRSFGQLGSGQAAVLDTNIQKLLTTTIDRACRRGWGPLHGQLVAALEELQRPPQLPWRRLLRLFVAQTGATHIRNTMSRASKRYGTVPGTKVRHRHKLTVVVDTSGSIGNSELATFFSEIHAIWRRGTTVGIVEADAAVANVYRYKGGLPQQVSGRGGTCFDPAIEWSNQNVSDGVVYFTDGVAPRPTVPSRVPILWVLTADGEDDNLTGRIVRLGP